MRPKNILKKNCWLILAAVALLGMMLAPRQTHAAPVAKIPALPQVKILSVAPRALAVMPRLQTVIPAAAAAASVKASPAQRIAKILDAVSAPGDDKQTQGTRPDDARRIFDNGSVPVKIAAPVRSSERLTLPERDLEAELGLR